MDSDSLQCVICYTPLEDEASAKVTPCGHSCFCDGCLLRAAESSVAAFSCPVCKTPALSLVVCRGSREVVCTPPKPREGPDETPPDLSCLDHSFFLSEIERLKGFAADASAELPETPAMRTRSVRIAAVVAELQDIAATLIDDDSCGYLDPDAMLGRLYALQADVEAASDLAKSFTPDRRRTPARRVYSAEDAESASEDDLDDGTIFGASSRTFDAFVTLDRQQRQSSLSSASSSSSSSSLEKAKAKRRKQRKAKKRAQQKEEQQQQHQRFQGSSTSSTTTPKAPKVAAESPVPRQATD